MNRREYIDRVARGGLVGALAAMAGILVYRRQVTYDAGCTRSFQCSACTKLDRCELPEAETTRDHGEKG